MQQETRLERGGFLVGALPPDSGATAVRASLTAKRSIISSPIGTGCTLRLGAACPILSSQACDMTDTGDRDYAIREGFCNATTPLSVQTPDYNATRET